MIAGKELGRAQVSATEPVSAFVKYMAYSSMCSESASSFRNSSSSSRVRSLQSPFILVMSSEK